MLLWTKKLGMQKLRWSSTIIKSMNRINFIIVLLLAFMLGFVAFPTMALSQERASEVRQITEGVADEPLLFDADLETQEEIPEPTWRERIQAGQPSLYSPAKDDFTDISEYKAFPHNGQKRFYKIHLPANYDKAQKWPVVVVFHGGGGNADAAARMTEMNAKADAEGFIVVYPEGTGPYKHRLLTWNTWNCCGQAQKRNVDDIGFIRELLFTLDRKYSINPRRIYVTGFSNGGMLAYRAACELSDIVAAFAPVAGAMNGDCYPQRAIPMIVFHGMEDQHVPYQGGSGEKSLRKRIDTSVSDSVGFFTYHNNCLSTPNRQKRGNVIHDSFVGCQNGGNIEVYSIVDQGHAWPGGQKSRRIGSDMPSSEISATDIIWDFFERHPFY